MPDNRITAMEWAMARRAEREAVMRKHYPGLDQSLLDVRDAKAPEPEPMLAEVKDV